MSHTPYGYVIRDGAAYIDEEKAKRVRKLFDGYISGLALQPAAEKAGLYLFHGSVGRMLRNKRYLGDGYYPPIIDIETFNEAEEIRISRAASLGRIKELDAPPKPTGAVSFTMPKVPAKYSDPFRQAEYAYSMIETEEVRDE